MCVCVCVGGCVCVCVYDLYNVDSEERFAFNIYGFDGGKKCNYFKDSY